MTDIDTSIERIGPYKIDLIGVGLTAMSASVGGFVAGAFIFMCAYGFLNSFHNVGEMFPIVLSVIGFFAGVISVSFTLFLQRLIFVEKYRAGITIFSHVYILSIVCFVVMVPLYVTVGNNEPGSALNVLIIHLLLTLFGSTVITEVIASYRYVLLGIYGSFIGLLIACVISIILRGSTSGASSPMFTMVVFTFLVTVSIATVRVLIEWLYYRMYLATGTDPLGDVFGGIERQDREDLREAEAALVKF